MKNPIRHWVTQGLYFIGLILILAAMKDDNPTLQLWEFLAGIVFILGGYIVKRRTKKTAKD
jgi:hypothetical protein